MSEPTTTETAGGLTRRATLKRLAGLAVVAASGGTALALEAASPAAAGPNAVAAGLLTCVLTPELSEGPYWIAGDRVRRDITEGRPGTPLLLRATVLNVATCKPVANAAVDIWHCDAGGTYSGIADSKRFLRGSQRTTARGVVEFATIYPGWYPGRTIHIHVKVWAGGNVVHTGQLFFPDDVTDAVFKAAPYARRGARSTRNANDSIYVNGGVNSVLKLTRAAKGWTGTVTMGVQAT